MSNGTFDIHPFDLHSKEPLLPESRVVCRLTFWGDFKESRIFKAGTTFYFKSVKRGTYSGSEHDEHVVFRGDDGALASDGPVQGIDCDVRNRKEPISAESIRRALGGLASLNVGDSEGSPSRPDRPSSERKASGKTKLAVDMNCNVVEEALAQLQVPGRLHLSYSCKGGRSASLLGNAGKVLAAPFCASSAILARESGEYDECMPAGAKWKVSLKVSAVLKGETGTGIQANAHHFSRWRENEEACQDTASLLNSVRGDLKIIARCNGAVLSAYFEAN